MRICIDIDGVLCHLKQENQSYADIEPIAGAVEKLRALRAHGHVIILFTARHMKTCNGNLGLVMARIGRSTLDWLARYEVEYDEIYFGKPWADIYLDDNAMRFHAWDEIEADGSNLPRSTESSRPSGKIIP